MKIDSGKETFTFEANGTGQPREVTLGILAALRAAVGAADPDEPNPRFAQADRLRQHVRGRGLDITEDEADNLLDTLYELDGKKKASVFARTLPSSTTSTPSP